MRKTREWRCDEERIIREGADKTDVELSRILIHRSPVAISARARTMGVLLKGERKRLTITSQTVQAVKTMVKRLGIEETARRLNLKTESVQRKIYTAKN